MIMKIIIIGGILGLSIFMMGRATMIDQIKSNAVKGYHCGKITKHIGLESAKAQVLINQKLAASTVIGIEK